MTNDERSLNDENRIQRTTRHLALLDQILSRAVVTLTAALPMNRCARTDTSVPLTPALSPRRGRISGSSRSNWRLKGTMHVTTQSDLAPRTTREFILPFGFRISFVTRISDFGFGP